MSEVERVTAFCQSPSDRRTIRRPRKAPACCSGCAESEDRPSDAPGNWLLYHQAGFCGISAFANPNSGNRPQGQCLGGLVTGPTSVGVYWLRRPLPSASGMSRSEAIPTSDLPQPQTRSKGDTDLNVGVAEFPRGCAEWAWSRRPATANARTCWCAARKASASPTKSQRGRSAASARGMEARMEAVSGYGSGRGNGSR